MRADLLLANSALAVSLSPKGGVLTGGTAGGRAFLRAAQAPGPTESACFPMVPICNRVAGNHFGFVGQDHVLQPNADDPLYLHGDGWLANWQVVELGTAHATLGFEHDTGPFRYRATQKVRLEHNVLHLQLIVQNIGAAPMPFGLGFHPYFPREGAEVAFTAAARWTETPGHLPGIRQPIPAKADFTSARALPDSWQNNAYDGWSGLATIRWPGLVVEMRADPLLGALMLYAPTDDTSFFCLEPMSHLPNALNMISQPGLRVLAPGDALTGGIRMTITETGAIP